MKANLLQSADLGKVDPHPVIPRSDLASHLRTFVSKAESLLELAQMTFDQRARSPRETA